jgi:hypothetical protein
LEELSETLYGKYQSYLKQAPGKRGRRPFFPEHDARAFAKVLATQLAVEKGLSREQTKVLIDELTRTFKSAGPEDQKLREELLKLLSERK